MPAAPRPDVVEAWQRHRAALERLRDNGGLGPAGIAQVTGLPRDAAKSLYGAIVDGAEWLGSSHGPAPGETVGGPEREDNRPGEDDEWPSDEPPPIDKDWTFERLGSFARCWSRPGSSVRTVEDLLRVAGVDPDEWVAVDGRANSWPTSMKLKRREECPDGSVLTTQDVVQVDNTQVSVKLERRVAFDCPPCPPVPDHISKRASADPPSRPEKVALLIPDPQYGFRWARNLTALEPLHDPLAIDCAIQLAAILQPDEIINLGDLMDLAAFGRYRCPPELRQTTTPSIWACHWDFLQLREACPHATISVCPGNHDDRPDKALIDGLPEATTVRAVGEDAAPLDLPGLLKLDELRVEWRGQYGDSYWLWREHTEAPAEITHGTAHGKRVWTQVGGLLYSFVQGHCHRLGIVWKTVRMPDGSQRQVFAASPGCVCRTDGAVPGANTRQDWQQGVMVATLIDGVVYPEVVPIINGTLTYGGMVIRGRDRSDELAAWMRDNDPRGIGWPQVAQHTYRRAA